MDVSWHVGGTKKYNCKKDWRVLFAPRETAIDFTLFTMANTRAKRDTSDRVVTFLFPRCQSLRKAWITVTGAYLTSPTVYPAQWYRGAGRDEKNLTDRFREEINRDRVDLLRGIRGIRRIRTNRTNL